MEDFIRRYYVSDPTLCKKVIEEFEASYEIHVPGCVSENGEFGVDEKYKKSTEISFELKRVYMENKYKSLIAVLEEVWKSVCLYMEEFRIVAGCEFECKWFNIQKFKPDEGFFLDHFEAGSLHTSDRLMVFMVYLNTVTDKGQTKFTYYDHLEEAVEGKILIWPTGYTHTHRSVPSPTQTKYIITGWYSFTS